MLYIDMIYTPKRQSIAAALGLIPSNPTQSIIVEFSMYVMHSSFRRHRLTTLLHSARSIPAAERRAISILSLG